MLIRSSALVLALAIGCVAPPNEAPSPEDDVLITSNEEATDGWVEIGPVPYGVVCSSMTSTTHSPFAGPLCVVPAAARRMATEAVASLAVTAVAAVGR